MGREKTFDIKVRGEHAGLLLYEFRDQPFKNLDGISDDVEYSKLEHELRKINHNPQEYFSDHSITLTKRQIELLEGVRSKVEDESELHLEVEGKPSHPYLGLMPIWDQLSKIAAKIKFETEDC